MISCHWLAAYYSFIGDNDLAVWTANVNNKGNIVRMDILCGPERIYEIKNYV